MENLKKISLYICVILFLSCNNTKGNKIKSIKSEQATIQVCKDSIPQHFNLLADLRSDFFSLVDSIQIIKLESTDKAIIGNISNTFLINDTLIICDVYKSKTIFAFNLDGMLLYKINKVGNGPGEYQSINMIQITHNKIIILDRMSWKLIEYNIVGDLISEKRIEPCPSDFIILDKNIIVSYNQYHKKTPFQLEFMDVLLNKKGNAFNFKNQRAMSIGAFSGFQINGHNSCLYHFAWCDTIFQITGTELYPKYTFDLYKPNEINNLFAKYETEQNNSKFNNLLHNEDIAFLSNFFELDDYLYVDWVKNRIGYKTLISKVDSICRNFITADLKKNRFTVPCLINGFYHNSLFASIDETFINKLSLVDQNSFYSHIKNQHYIDIIKELENSNNNPVVCVFHIKDGE